MTRRRATHFLAIRVIDPKAEGCVQFCISVKVDMAELARWEPDRIAMFFNGIAKVVAAKGPATGMDDNEIIGDEIEEDTDPDEPSEIDEPTDTDDSHDNDSK